MLHNIWIARFHKVIIGALLVGSSILASAQEQNPAQEKPESPKSKYLGVFETIDQILRLDNKSYQSLMTEINKNPLVLTTLDKLEGVKLDPVFLRSIIFHSPTKYIDISSENQCRFYSMLENSLLTRPGFDGRSIPIQYKRKGETLSGIVPFKDFFAYIYKTKCSSNRDINKLFLPNNVKKTVEAFEFKIPNNQAECYQIFEEWKSNDYIAPFCKMAENIKLGKLRESQLPSIQTNDILLRRKFRTEILRGNNYKDILGEYKSDYLAHLCENLGSRQLFCSKYLTKSFWKKSNTLANSPTALQFKCKSLLNKKDITADMIRLCANRFTLEDEVCQYLGSNMFPALTPMPNCNHQSTALNIGKLVTNYRDCPGKIENSGIVNSTRLIFHLNKSRIDSQAENCDTIPTKTFLNFQVQNKNEDIWKPRICYADPFNENKEKCLQVLLADIDYEKYTEKKIIAEILRIKLDAPRKLDCKSASKDEYKPDRLKWKFGCFMVYDPENCSRNYCPKTIYYQNKKVEGIEYKGAVAFDYFPNVIRDDQKSFAYVLEEARKYRRKAIRSVTDLKYYINLSDSSVVHGVGCAEDLLPTHFRKYRMNQCTPIPFLIDGLLEEKFRYFVSIRTSIDDIHSPRMVSWYNVFNSVKNFNKFQPINHWTLYGAR